MKKLPTIFLGVSLILAAIPRVTVEKTDDMFRLTVGGAISEWIVKAVEKNTKKRRDINGQKENDSPGFSKI